MRSSTFALAGVLCVAAAFAACSSTTTNEASGSCFEGQSVACACVGGGQGAQVCRNGRYEACSCEGADGGALDATSGDRDAATRDGAPPPPSCMGVDASNVPGTASDGGACGVTPSLHPSNCSLYCPFGPADAGVLECASWSERCCIGGQTAPGQFADSQCVPLSSACANGANPKSLECEDSVDCPTGICCMAANAPSLDPTCGYYRATGLTGTRCEAAGCAAGEVQICEQSSECPKGMTCTPFKVSGLQLGFCQ